MITNIEYVRI